jgi:hypothetical protein
MTVVIKIALLLLFSSAELFCQEIAITFDDAPIADSPAMTGIQRTNRLLGELQSGNVKQVAFFVITGNREH